VDGRIPARRSFSSSENSVEFSAIDCAACSTSRTRLPGRSADQVTLQDPAILRQRERSDGLGRLESRRRFSLTTTSKSTASTGSCDSSVAVTALSMVLMSTPTAVKKKDPETVAAIMDVVVEVVEVEVDVVDVVVFDTVVVDVMVEDVDVVTVTDVDVFVFEVDVKLDVVVEVDVAVEVVVLVFVTEVVVRVALVVEVDVPVEVVVDVLVTEDEDVVVEVSV